MHKPSINTLITRTIDWNALATLAGLCLSNYGNIEQVIDCSNKSAAEEFAGQTAHQGRKAGIDLKKLTSGEDQGSITFTAPIWVVLFVTEILIECDKRGDNSGDLGDHWKPFARAAIMEIDNPGDHLNNLKGFRLN